MLLSLQPKHLTFIAWIFQVFILFTMKRVSAFSTCMTPRSISEPFSSSLLSLETRIRHPKNRIFLRSLCMGPVLPEEPANHSKFNIFKIIQQKFLSGQNRNGESGRRRFLRFGAALAAPLIAFETLRSFDGSVSSKIHAYAQAGLVESVVKPSISASDSKLAPNELNTIR